MFIYSCYVSYNKKKKIINNGVKLIEFLLRLRHTLSILHIEEKSIDYYVPTEPMIIHDSIIESITYWFQTEGMLW